MPWKVFMILYLSPFHLSLYFKGDRQKKQKKNERRNRGVELKGIVCSNDRHICKDMTAQTPIVITATPMTVLTKLFPENASYRLWF